MNELKLLSSARPAAVSLMSGYRPVPGAFDEMMGPDGTARPHWQPFLDEIGKLSEPALKRLWNTTQRLVRENGATYNVHDETGDGDRPWRMDPIPFLIAPEEWRVLEEGLIQRATLLNAIASDIYGGQSLLRQGLLPASLVFGNPNFLRPLHGVEPPGGVHLNLMAFDVARGADNRWWVLSNRTESPAGAGYALENRIVLSRTMPETLRALRAHRLAEFFQAMSDAMIAHTGQDSPLAVLLTPGPHSETYFEHAYLARYLGFPLVVGADLTVRDNKVYLKTLDGLKQVHLIFRRVTGENSDPLELRAKSHDGVAGLVEAIRAGTVVVANSLGAGVVESEALMAFLPNLCRSLFDEPLMLPSVATWWCGQPKEQAYVLDHLDRLVVRPSFARTSILDSHAGAILPSELSAADREALAMRIRRDGGRYFGQETLSLPTAPIWRGGVLEPRPVMLRVFVCADKNGSFRVMPGGLARTTEDMNSRTMRMSQGDASKDAWALSDTPVSNFTRLAAPDQPITLRRSSANLASRAGDNLFWFGRYAERAENSIRMIRSMLHRISGEIGIGEDPATLARLTHALVEIGYLPEGADQDVVDGKLVALESALIDLISKPDMPNGLLSLLADLCRTAALVRERLSVDSWRILNALRDQANAVTEAPLHMEDGIELLNAMLIDLAALSGMHQENMTRNLDWRMTDSGRRVERASHMTLLLREMTVDSDPAAEGRLDLLLELGDSSMTYRTRYLTSARLSPVLDLLLIDETNPRSVAFQVAALVRHAHALPRNSALAVLPQHEYLIEQLMSRLRLADAQAMSDQRDDDGVRSSLLEFLNATEVQVDGFSSALARAYFSHVAPMRSISGAMTAP